MKEISNKEVLREENPVQEEKPVRVAASKKEMPFVVFATMYSSSFVYELVEKWKDPKFGFLFIALFVALVMTRVQLSGYLGYLAAVIIYEMRYRYVPTSGMLRDG